MNGTSKIVIRADASPLTGTGHVMRCLALAQWAMRQRLDVRFVGRVQSLWVQERLRQESIPATLLEGDIPAREPARDVSMHLGVPSGNFWVVLDGYHFGLDYQRAVRAAGFKLLLVDDYAHLPEYSCDILLNQNLGAENLPYAGDIGSRLLGPRYAMLRPEFATAREAAEARIFPERPRNLLLTLGGGDASGHLKRIAPWFTLKELEGCVLRVIAGAMPEAAIRESFAACPAALEILSRVDDMPSLLLDTDLCVTGGGSTCWELCCLGVPFLTVEVAENQRGVMSGLAALGVAPESGIWPLRRMLENKACRETASRSGFSLVDGTGAARVARRLVSAMPALRPAGPQDSEFLWQLASSFDVRAVSLATESFSWEEHCKWYASRLQSAEPFFIACGSDGSPLGYIRLARDADLSATVSIALVPEARGRGFAPHLLREVCEQWRRMCPAVALKALILAENKASQAAFLAAGFRSAGEKDMAGRLFLLFVADNAG